MKQDQSRGRTIVVEHAMKVHVDILLSVAGVNATRRRVLVDKYARSTAWI